MNQQDKSFMLTFTTIMAVLVVVIVGIFMITRLVGVVSVEPVDEDRAEAIAEQRIEPDTQVAVAQPGEAAERVPMSAEEVVSSTCSSCHATGVMDAPKIGSGEDWGPRFEKGLSALMTSALSGIGNMPAKGGNPALTEEEIRGAVEHMLGQSGIDVAAAEEPAPEEAEASAEATAEAEPEPEPEPMDPAEAARLAQEAAQAAQEAAEAAREAAEAARKALEAINAEALPMFRKARSAARRAEWEEELAAMDEVQRRIHPVARVAVAAEAEEEEEAPAGEAAGEAAAAPEPVAAVEPSIEHGEQIYASACFACHDTGAAGAPKRGDAAAWTPRADQGIDTLVEHAVNGFNTMPPKGGNPALSEADVRSAVMYMLSEAGLESARADGPADARAPDAAKLAASTGGPGAS